MVLVEGTDAAIEDGVELIARAVEPDQRVRDLGAGERLEVDLAESFEGGDGLRQECGVGGCQTIVRLFVFSQESNSPSTLYTA
ncbi:MAG: hypothetical protein WAM30_06025 [Candidatus Dormiibacterota bacterium]